VPPVPFRSTRARRTMSLSPRMSYGAIALPSGCKCIRSIRWSPMLRCRRRSGAAVQAASGDVDSALGSRLRRLGPLLRSHLQRLRPAAVRALGTLGYRVGGSDSSMRLPLRFTSPRRRRRTLSFEVTLESSPEGQVRAHSRLGGRSTGARTCAARRRPRGSTRSAGVTAKLVRILAAQDATSPAC
jgi:hypothetical protein